MNTASTYQLTNSMKQYLLPAMLSVFGDKCALCGEQWPSYEIDHIRYGDDVTMYDLQLVCVACHKDKTMNDSDAWLTRTPHCATCACYD
jgi:hypothetical protein